MPRLVKNYINSLPLSLLFSVDAVRIDRVCTVPQSDKTLRHLHQITCPFNDKIPTICLG